MLPNMCNQIYANKYMLPNKLPGESYLIANITQQLHWCYVVGNLGLEDVRVALGWVQQNIGDFGLFSKVFQEELHNKSVFQGAILER